MPAHRSYGTFNQDFERKREANLGQRRSAANKDYKHKSYDGRYGKDSSNTGESSSKNGANSSVRLDRGHTSFDDPNFKHDSHKVYSFCLISSSRLANAREQLERQSTSHHRESTSRQPEASQSTRLRDASVDWDRYDRAFEAAYGKYSDFDSPFKSKSHGQENWSPLADENWDIDSYYASGGK